MCTVPSPGALDPPSHNFIIVSFEILQVHFDARLFIFAKETQLANVDIFEILSTKNVLQLSLLLLSEGFRSTDERNL